MKNKDTSAQEIPLNRYFWCIMFLQLLLWSFVPIFIRHSTTNDLIEALVWGRQFEWGYDKNPFLVGVLAHIGGLVANNGFGVYLIQQLFIILGVWSTKQLTFELTANKSYAFVSATALLLYFFYNFEVQLFNDNYILLGLLPFSALCFYLGVNNNDLKNWLFSAASLALATLAKYSAIFFLPVYFFYLVFSKKGRGYLFSSKPYLAFLLFGLMLIPHLIWLNQHDFYPFHYAFIERGALKQLSNLQNLLFSVSSLFSSLLKMLPGLLAIITAIEYKRGLGVKLLNSNDTFFSCLLGFGPIIFFFLLASILGFLIQIEWFVPFLSFVGTAFFVIFKPPISKHSINRYIIVLITLMIITNFSYILVSKKRTELHYPGPEMAKFATQLWHTQYQTKLSYIAGNRFPAGYIAFYSSDKPQVWTEWDTTRSSWIDLHVLRCKGALFVTEKFNARLHETPDFPAQIRQQFPELHNFPIQIFKWYRNPANKPPIKVRFALLPPNKDYCYVKQTHKRTSFLFG